MDHAFEQPPQRLHSPPPDTSEYLRNDPWLNGVPEVFLQHALEQLAPRLIDGRDCILPFLPPQPSTKLPPSARPSKRRRTDPSPLPATIRCRLPASFADSQTSIAPTHFLACPYRPTHASSSIKFGFIHGGHLLIPIHDLPFALKSPVLAALLYPARPPPEETPSDGPAPSAALLDAATAAASAAASSTSNSASPEQAEASTAFPSGLPISAPYSPPLSAHDTYSDDLTSSPANPPSAPAHQLSSPAFLHLPVVSLDIPHLPSFALFRSFIYSRDTTALVDSLFATPAPSRRNGVYLVRDRVRPPAPAHKPAMESRIANMQEEELEVCLDRIGKLRELAVFLEVSDGALWATMHQAWETVVDTIEARYSSDDEEEDGNSVAGPAPKE
ncbi:hypothetical protein JCM8547_007315 [Rhodosporidiobolus lusitaniae]